MAKDLPFAPTLHSSFSPSRPQTTHSIHETQNIIPFGYRLYLLHTTCSCSYSCDLSPARYINTESSPTALSPAPPPFPPACLPTCIRLFGALIFPSYVPSIDNHNHITDPDLAWPKGLYLSRLSFDSQLFCHPHKKQNGPRLFHPRIQDQPTLVLPNILHL